MFLQFLPGNGFFCEGLATDVNLSALLDFHLPKPFPPLHTALLILTIVEAISSQSTYAIARYIHICMNCTLKYSIVSAVQSAILHRPCKVNLK